MNYIARETVLPVRVVEISGEYLNINALFCRKELQIGLNETNLFVFKGKGHLVLDFGKEIKGGVRILTDKGTMGKVRLRLGESVGESSAEIGENNANNDCSVRDAEIVLPSHSDILFFDTGFRFARLDLEENVSISIKNIYAEGTYYKRRTIVPFKFADKEIQSIFDAAKRTVDLCIGEEYVWDGIKRDRLVWIGDLYPEMLAATSLYGRVEQVENSLNFVREQTPLPQWINGIQTYSLWWIITLGEYYLRTKCFDFLKQQAEYLSDLVDMLMSYIDENGNLAHKGYFIDWQTDSGSEENCGGSSLHIIAFKYASVLLAVLGKPVERIKFVASLLRKTEMPDCKKKQIIALKYLATGEISEKEKTALMKGGASGISSFMSCIILNTMAETIGTEFATETMKEYFGGMLSKGATTFFEDFDIDWLENSSVLYERRKGGEKDIHGDFGKYCYKGFRHSLCHGWSAGVIDFIKKYVI